MGEFQTQANGEVRTGTEGADAVRTAAEREAEAWKIAQLAAVFASRTREDRVSLDLMVSAVKDAKAVLAFARESVTAS